MPPKPRVRAGGAARPTPVKDTSAPGYGRVLTCLRIRLALTDEEGGVDNVALQCDRSQRLAWALGGEDSADEAPRQFAFDELLEQHQQQQECFDAVGAPAVKAAIAGGTGCVVCYGAKGAGKWYSMNNQSVGQEGIVPRINAMLFAGRGGTGGASMRLPAKDDVAEEQRLAKMRIEVAYLVLTKEQQVRDLLAGAGVALSTDPLSDPLRFATWQPAASAAEVSRLLARGDANKPQGLERGAGLKEWHSLVAYRLTQDNGASGTLLLASLADADAVISDGLSSSTPQLHSSMEALGASLEAMASGKPGDFHSTHAPLTALLASALGDGAAAGVGEGLGARSVGTSFTALLLCVHPHKQRLAQTLHTLQLGQRGGAGGRARGGVDYMALGSQLIMQRDAKQEALHELELEVLRKLRPQLEQVMWQEQGLAQLAARLQQTEWEARSYADKEAPLQMQMQQQREMHAQQMAAIKAERAQISADLQRAMGAVGKGSPELANMRRKHEEDTEVLTKRLQALQIEVELAESEVAMHDQASTQARVLLPAVARDLAALALQLCERGKTHEAAAVFANSLAVLEGAFGHGNNELDGFKAEVKRAVAAATEEGMARAGDMSERGAAIGIAPGGGTHRGGGGTERRHMGAYDA